MTLCNCHACTCSGCNVCDPPEPRDDYPAFIPPEPPADLVDPWDELPIGGAA